MPRNIFVIFNILISNIIIVNVCYAGDLYIEEQISGTITGNSISDVRKIIIRDNDFLIIDPALTYKTLFKFNDKKAFLIDDLNKRYSVIGIDDFKMPVKEKFVSVFELFNKSDIRYKESGNKRKIGKYDCFEVIAFLPRAAVMINLWLTKDIDAPINLYFSFLDKVKIEGSQIEQIVKIMRENNSYPVESIITMVKPGEDNKFFKILLKEISGREIPDSEFAFPGEYSRFVLK